MNTQLSTRGRHDHPPEQKHIEIAHPARSVGLVDRLALHVGVALIKWGRRPSSTESRERRAHRIEQRLAQIARERETERRLLLTLPPR
jgi:hypothetical protein